eukprot:EG_transcript_13240
MIRTYHKAVQEFWLAFLPSYMLFWPRSWGTSDLVVVLDDDSPNDHRAGSLLSLLPPYPRVVYEAPPPPRTLCSGWRREGYARQVWSNLYADRHSEADFIGLSDTDAFFTTPVLPADLFNLSAGPPRPRVLGYNGCCSPWNSAVEYAIGQPSVAEFMIVLGFPFIVHRDHFSQLRKHITAHRKADNFEQAFHSVCRKYEHTSQFAILGNYLWHFQREHYDWHLIAWKTSRHVAFSKNMDSSPAVLAENWPMVGVSKHAFAHTPQLFALLPDYLCSASGWRFGHCPSEPDQSQIEDGVAYNLLTDWITDTAHFKSRGIDASHEHKKERLPKGWRRIIAARKARLANVSERWPWLLLPDQRRWTHPPQT